MGRCVSKCVCVCVGGGGVEGAEERKKNLFSLNTVYIYYVFPESSVSHSSGALISNKHVKTKHETLNKIYFTFPLKGVVIPPTACTHCINASTVLDAGRFSIINGPRHCSLDWLFKNISL